MPTEWGDLLQIQADGALLAFDVADGSVLAMADPVFEVTEDSVLWANGEIVLWPDGDQELWEETA